MRLPDVVHLMCELGVTRNPATLARLIRFVQECEGNTACFNGRGGDCGRRDCAWREICTRAPTDHEPAVVSRSFCPVPRLTSLIHRNIPAASSWELC